MVVPPWELKSVSPRVVRGPVGTRLCAHTRTRVFVSPLRHRHLLLVPVLSAFDLWDFFCGINKHKAFFFSFSAICHKILEYIKFVAQVTCLIGGGGGEGLRQKQRKKI